jgi:tRNA A-37 threonylcarbamoyl transferase component Bud32
MEPTKFGRYEIKGEIGRGGMATVYHAYDPRFEREVAIKVLPHEMLHDVQFRTRFEREAKTVAMLEHPAIVPVYDFGEEDGQPYFVMRFMTGGSLSDRMKLGPMSVTEAARLMAHLAPALDEAHAKGIVHRDLKPGNILYDQYNQPYISDFGIAKLSESQANVTGSAIVGTPAYMSPEQAQGEGIDGRSDIYGLGVILFEMLTGQQPYHGDTPMSVVVKHITDPVPHILDVKPELPSDLEEVVEKAMAKDRNERYQTVKALAEDLEAIAKGEKPKLPASDATMTGMTTTVVKPKPPVQTLAETVIKKQEQLQTPPPTPTPVPVPATSRKLTGLWVGLGVVAFLLVVAVGAALLFFRNKIPFLAGPLPTETRLVLQDTPTSPALTQPATPYVILPVVPTDTPAPIKTALPTFTPTVQGPPVLGGADQIAFLSDNNIWTVGVDGGGLTQITKDNADKHDLQYSPDGSSLFYITGKCIHFVSIDDKKDSNVTCFTSSTYLDAFEIAPDGKQVAISLDRVLYVVPFDVISLSAARNWTYLRDMKGCLIYGSDHQHGQPIIKQVRWSGDGTKIAANTLSVSADGTRADLILVFDISKCDGNITSWLDNFPGSRFKMAGFAQNPVIPYFSWDGQSLFLLNGAFRYNTGYLYSYNYETKAPAVAVTPFKFCCYQGATWSPDGSQIMFAYQDIDAGGSPKLYLVPYGSLGTGASYEPFPLSAQLFSKPGTNIEVALRRAK